ncbi:flavodoxin [Enterococcus sp. DIV0756]|uniref:flavodoxin n=1 Tax=Enterococcus sp. DIV0756 TaxID=2774636 RepID=UPI003F210FE9
MKRAILLLTTMLLPLTACSQEESVSNQENTDFSITINDNSESDNDPSNVTSSEVLIAYFTWADNTTVENPDSVDIDATTSASVLDPGNTKIMAAAIQNRIAGDQFSIRTKNLYSPDYDECLDQADVELRNQERPELIGNVENFEQYEVIFLGFPNWWYHLPMPIHSFVESNDFSNKIVIPFCAHGTGGLASSIDDLRDALPESTTLAEPVGIYREDMNDVENIINDWIDSLPIKE